MAYCGPKGIPYEAFTTEWSDLSRDAALAWQARENDRCRGCGMVDADMRQYDETGAPVLDEDGVHLAVETLPVVMVPRFCPGCAAQKRAQDGNDYEQLPGTVMRWVPDPTYVPPPEPVDRIPDPGDDDDEGDAGAPWCPWEATGKA